MPATSKIAIVGTGLVGSGWAIVFARGGLDIALFDAVEGAAARARETIGSRLSESVRRVCSTRRPRSFWRGSGLADAHRRGPGASYVQESVLERTDVKRAVFAEWTA